MNNIVKRMFNIKVLIGAAALLTIVALAQLTIFSLHVAFDGTKYDNVTSFLIFIETILIFIPTIFTDFAGSQLDKDKDKSDKSDKDLNHGFISFLLVLYIVTLSNSVIAMTFIIYDSMAVTILYSLIVIIAIIISTALSKK